MPTTVNLSERQHLETELSRVETQRGPDAPSAKMLPRQLVVLEEAPRSAEACFRSGPIRFGR